jgi:hypothetical protein
MEEYKMQRAADTINNTAIKYNWNISVIKTKTIPMKRKMNVRNKIVIYNYIIKEINSSNYFDYTITTTNNADLEIIINNLIQCAEQEEKH